jgi:hypothetical protein
MLAGGSVYSCRLGCTTKLASECGVEAVERSRLGVIAQRETENPDRPLRATCVEQDKGSERIDDRIIGVLSAGTFNDGLGPIEFADAAVGRGHADQRRPLVRRVEAEFQSLFVVGYRFGLSASFIVGQSSGQVVLCREGHPHSVESVESCC